MIQRLFRFAADHPRSVLILLALITAGFASQLGHLRLHISAESLMTQDPEAQRIFRRTQDLFGSDQVVLLVFQDPQPLAEARLRGLQQIQERLQALPYVARVDSLFSIQHFTNQDGTIGSAPYIQALPLTPEQQQQLWKEALRNPFLADRLASRDHTSLAMVVHLKPTDQREIDDQQITRDMDALLVPIQALYQHAFQLGRPYVRAAISQHIRDDQYSIMPLSLAVLTLSLMFALGRLRNALVPLVTAGLSVVWTLGFMALLDLPLDVMTSVVPALLVIIGSTEDIHLLAAYQSGIGNGLTRQQAIIKMSDNTGLAVFLTFITSYLGFLSIATVDISLLQRFGLVASTGLLFNFLITVLLIPAYLSYWGDTQGREVRQERLFGHVALSLFQATRRRPMIVALATLFLVLFALFGATRLQVDNNTISYFGEHTELRQRLDRLNAHLSGMHSFDIVLDGRIEGTFLKVRYLQEITKIQRHLAESGDFDQSLSFADYLALVNTIIDEPDSKELFLPDSDDLAAAYMAFIKPEQVRAYLDPEAATARINVRHHLDASRDLNRALEDLEDYLRGTVDPDLDVDITGESVLTDHAADQMARGQARSLLLMLFTIFLMISLLFMNLNAGALAMVPVTIPIVMLFGIMGLTGIPLDTSTSMVAAIAIGICVDDTVHFMVRYNQNIRIHQDRWRSIEATLSEEARPIIATSIALALGFATLALSSFPPVVNFGLLSTLVILLALAANFLLTPLLLSRIHLITLWDLFSMQLRHQVTHQCALFHGMSQWQIRKVVLLGQRLRFKPGEAIVTEGELGDTLYLILDGQVVVEHHQTRPGQAVATLYPGQLFGEIALVAQVRRTADVIASKDTEVLVIRWRDLERVGRLYPRLAARLYLNVAYIVGQRLVRLSQPGALSHNSVKT